MLRAVDERRGGRSPGLSVLMPVRDGERELSEAIESLEAQSFTDFEVIVVDDGSRDRTPELLEAWRQRDRRVRLVRGPRRGIAAALGVALELARAPLVARMDSDDLAHPERFEAQLERLEASPELAVLGTHVEIFPRGEALRGGMRRYERWLRSLVTTEEIRRDLFIESPLCHPSIMARRAALVEVGGYRDIDGPEDYDLWLRLARTGAAMANLPRVLLRWRDRPERATRRDRRYRAEAILELKLGNLLGWRLAGAQRLGIWGAGPFGKRWARQLSARGVGVDFFVEVDRRKIGQEIHGARVIAPQDLPPPSAAPLLVAVGVEGARELIRGELTRRGWTEGDHFLCVQ